MEVTILLAKDTPDVIHQAAQLLKQGELVAFPTETVYGLGADAENAQAVQKIFAVKSRPLTQPLSVLIPDATALSRWSQAVSPAAYLLAQAFWPGPLTLIVPPAEQVLDLLTAGQPGIGLRVPRHPTAQALLKSFGAAIAAPSANLSMQFSPTCAMHVQRQLGDKIPLIVDGGACALGLESTVLDLTSRTPCVLRIGAISVLAIQAVLQQPVDSTIWKKSTLEKRPGCFSQLKLQPVSAERFMATVAQQCEGELRFAVLARRPAPEQQAHNVLWVMMPEAAIDYQRCFYAKLQQLVLEGYTEVLIEALPDTDAWEGLRSSIDRFSQNPIVAERVTESIVEERNG